MDANDIFDEVNTEGPVIINAVEWDPESSDDEDPYKEEDPQIVFKRFKEGNGDIWKMDLTDNLLAVFKQNRDFLSKNIPIARFYDSYFIRGDTLILEFMQLFKSVELYNTIVEPLDFTDKIVCELLRTTSFFLDNFHKERIELCCIPRPFIVTSDAVLEALLANKTVRFSMRGCICQFSCEAVKNLIKEMVKVKTNFTIDWHLGTINYFNEHMAIAFLEELKKDPYASFDYEVEEYKFTIKFGNCCEISLMSCEDLDVKYYLREEKYIVTNNIAHSPGT